MNTHKLLFLLILLIHPFVGAMEPAKQNINAEMLKKAKQNINAEMLKIDKKIFNLYKKAREYRISQKIKEIDYAFSCKIKDAMYIYKAAKDHLDRCERLDNIECFEILEEELREWNSDN